MVATEVRGVCATVAAVGEQSVGGDVISREQGSGPDLVDPDSAPVDSTHPPGWQPTLKVEPEPRRWADGHWTKPLVALGVVVALLAAAAVMATRLPPDSTLAGSDVDTVDDATAALAAAQQQLDEMQVQFVTTVGTQTEMRGDELGLTIDEQGSVEPIQQGLPSLSAWIRRVPEGPQQFPFVIEPPQPAPLGDVAQTVSVEPTDVDVVIKSAGVEVREGADGVDVDAGQVEAALDAALAGIAGAPLNAWPDVLDVPIDGSVPPPTITQADLDGILKRVEEVQSAQVTVTAATPEDTPDASITLSPREVRDLLGVQVIAGAADGERLKLVADTDGAPGRLIALLDLARVPAELRARVENRSPTPEIGEDVTDVSTITGDVVAQEGGQPGFEPDRDATLNAVVQTALQGGGDVQVAGAEAPLPDPTEVGITQPVSTFTTYYAAGQSRVQNIRRIAEIVDGTVIPSGESYEINAAVGPRTRDNGFTEGGAIIDGELVTDLGGGISQFATTFFNAAWFAGVELVDWKPHSVYFPRYPAGREATINYPNVNLEIRNDTPHAILVDTATDDTSVTVTFWSTPYWQVETVTEPCACGGEFYMTVDRIKQTADRAPTRESYTTLYVLPEEPSEDE